MTTRPLFTNNAATALVQAITPTDTVLQITAGTGSYFPSPTGGDYFMLTLIQINNPEVSEIVKCTLRVGDYLTVVRGEEGTQPQIFNISDNVELRITASSLNLFAIGGGGGGGSAATQVAEFTATQGQTAFVLPFTYVPNQNNLAVFVNGSKQVVDTNYAESSTNTVTFISGLNVGDVVEVIYNLPIAAGEVNATNIYYEEPGTGAIQRTVQDKINELPSSADFDNNIDFNNYANSLTHVINHAVQPKTVIRTLTSKFQDFISLKDYGAIGDGTTDDTAAIQAAITANSSNAIIDGGGLTYKITATLTIPNGSRQLKLQNFSISATGDMVALSSATSTDLISFFTLDKCLFTCAGHTTAGRRAIDFSCFSQSTFHDVWINGTSGKTIAFYGIGTNGGSAPYYNVFDHCYIGNISTGISFDDASGVLYTSNSNTVSNCRIQPGTGNFGVYIGTNNQNNRIINCEFESVGGTGVYCAGIASTITGNRFESMTTALSYAGGAIATFETGNYFDSNATNRSVVGAATYLNNSINSSTTSTGVVNYLYGNTVLYPTGNQNGSSVFSRSIGNNYSNFTSDSDQTASTNWRHFTGYNSTGGAVNYIVFGNGNVQNTNNSYGAISDLTLKENIVDASPKLPDLLKVQVRNYTLKEDKTKLKQLGVVAQELEAVFPSLVETDSEGLKSVKYSIFVPMLIKAIQEQQVQIEELKAKVGI